jgi:hypothetical protein
MPLRKPFVICNKSLDLFHLQDHGIYSSHEILLKDMDGHYELWVLFKGIALEDIQVYRCNESIKVYHKKKAENDNDAILLSYLIPANVKLAEVSAKERRGCLCIIMPKIRKVANAKPILLSIERM